MNPQSTFMILASVLLITASLSAAARPDDSFGEDLASDLGMPELKDLDNISTEDYTSTVCEEQGPCYKMKLTCPDECYKEVSKSGESFGADAKAGGCVMDCKEKCKAYC